MVIFLIFLLQNVSPTFLTPQLDLGSINQTISKRESNKAKAQELISASTLSSPSILRIGALKPENLSVNYDPLKIGWYYNLIRNSLLYDSLVQYDPVKDRITPALAKKWVVSNDSKHWTFYLREDITFHDGSKFNASSVKFMYDRIIDPDNPGYVQYLGMDIVAFRDVLSSVTINDEFDVTINFEDSYSPFINSECLLIQIVSPNSFNDQGELETPIGTGPYILNSDTSNDTFQNFTSFTRYFKGVPPYEQINYFCQEDFNLTSQSIDFFPIAPRGIEYGDSLKLKEVRGEAKLLLGFFNYNRSELSNRLVRMAINYALNRSDYIKVVNETATSSSLNSLSPMNNLIPSSMFFTNNSIPGFPYDWKIANDLLDKAGYLRGTDGYRFSIDLVGPSYHNVHLIKPFLEAVGIRTNVIINDSIDYNWFWNGNYDIGLIGLTTTLDPHSIVNQGGFMNSTIDSLVMIGAQRPVKQEREYYYNKLQLLIQDAAPYLYLTYATGIYVTTTHVEPYVSLDKIGNIVFNYTTESDVILPHSKYSIRCFEGKNDLLAEYENIIVSDYPIYFPFTDAIVAPINERQLSVSMKMSHYLENFLPGSQKVGKFYQLTVDNKDIEYSLRCYYDLDEIKNISIEYLALFQWDEDNETWIALKTVSSNPYLRYIEVNVKGDVIIRFGEEFIQITYRYVPLFALTILGLSSFTIFTIVANIRFSRKFKGESQL